MRKRLFAFGLILCFFSTFFAFNCAAMENDFDDVLNRTFETKRLVLSKTSDDDLTFLAEYLMDKDVTRFLDVTTEDGFTCFDDALCYLKGGSEGDVSGAYTIRLRESRVPIGQITVNFYGDPDDMASVALGYWIAKDFQGNGLAKEAVLRVFKELLDDSRIRVVNVSVDARNIASINLIYKMVDFLGDCGDVNLNCSSYDFKDIEIKGNLIPRILFHVFNFEKVLVKE